MLKAGDIAPDFSLPDAAMEIVSLAGFRGKKHVVLCFFPKVSNPGCTILAEEFSDHEDDFQKRNAVVMAISREDCLSLEAFVEHHGLGMPLLSDTEGEVCKSYGVMKERPNNGGPAVTRSTFVIDKSGVVRHALAEPNPRGHTAEVLKLVKVLG